MSLTTEQQAVVDYIQNKKEEDILILVNAVAGSGKTHLLTSIANTIPHKEALYLAYNKSIAEEAGSKFPPTVKCSTAHSLAYRATVKQFGLKVGFFSYRDVKDSMPYEAKLDLIENIREFCLSSYTDFTEFATVQGISEIRIAQCEKYLEKMYQGSIDCTHDFYMKLFHISLADGSIEIPKQDFLMVDEAGDLSAVTLEIFKLIPARVKIACGDVHQNIYGFNYTVNAFEELKEGVRFNLTKSFRVSASIAKRIETFCKKHLDEDMQFVGTDYEDTSIKTRAFLSRTNSALVGAIIDLYESRTSFTTVRSPVELFKLPLALCFAKYEGTIGVPEYKHIQQDINEWFESPELQTEYSSFLAYLLSIYDFDIGLVSAINIIMQFGKRKIFDAYDYAKNMKPGNSSLFLATVHSTKGLEWDAVVILDDFNRKLSKIIADGLDPDNEAVQQEYNLYYVACSRARKSLVNAIHL